MKSMTRLWSGWERVWVKEVEERAQEAKSTQYWMIVYVGIEINKNYEKNSIRRNGIEPGAKDLYEIRENLVLMEMHRRWEMSYEVYIMLSIKHHNVNICKLMCH